MQVLVIKYVFSLLFFSVLVVDFASLPIVVSEGDNSFQVCIVLLAGKIEPGLTIKVEHTIGGNHGKEIILHTKIFFSN